MGLFGEKHTEAMHLVDGKAGAGGDVLIYATTSPGKPE